MLKGYNTLDLPPGSRITGTKAYNPYVIEDIVADAELELKPIRKQNSKRSYDPSEAYVVSYHRQSVETVARLIQRLMPASIHAVPAEGFELKVVLFILASSINKL